MSAPADRPHGMTATDITDALATTWDDPDTRPAAWAAFGAPVSQPGDNGAPSLGPIDRIGSDQL